MRCLAFVGKQNKRPTIQVFGTEEEFKTVDKTLGYEWDELKTDGESKKWVLRKNDFVSNPLSAHLFQLERAEKVLTLEVLPSWTNRIEWARKTLEEEKKRAEELKKQETTTESKYPVYFRGKPLATCPSSNCSPLFMPCKTCVFNKNRECILMGD